MAGPSADASISSTGRARAELRDDTNGALNVFQHTASRGSTADDTALAQALADVATIAILQHRTLGELVSGDPDPEEVLAFRRSRPPGHS